MKTDFVELYTLQMDLKEGIGDLFPDKLWVKAEIASISVKSGGHCYLDLVQSIDGKVVAQVRGIIWRSFYPLLSAKFKSENGTEIAAGAEVFVRAEVNFHELYGLSLQIDDIEGSGKAGGRQLQKAETLERLTKEGLLSKQKSLKMSELPYRLALVSAQGAAGLVDFRKHLAGNEYGFAYVEDFYPATMQGEGAPASIIAALQAIEASADKPDAVLLLRGGGSETDLSCFDDYSLCAAIARLPYPVITAIGHDKDYHLADMVAFDYVKTPTALADFFINITADADGIISELENRLALAFEGRLGGLESRLQIISGNIRSAVAARLSAAEGEVALLQTKIAATDPRNVLARGFSLTLDERGVKISSARQSREGDEISVLFADGRVYSKVKKIEYGKEV